MKMTKEMKDLLRGMFEGKIDDNWCETEIMAIVALQDIFDMTEDEADEVLQRFFQNEVAW